MRFIPAPAGLTVLPVIALSPSPQARGTRLPAETSSDTPETPAPALESYLTITQEIETSEGYILIGAFEPHPQAGGNFQGVGNIEIYDAGGKKVAYTYPADIARQVGQWAVQFSAADLSYPLTISYATIEVSPAQPAAAIEWVFDAGSDPQPGQKWDINQEFELAGHNLNLISIRADSRAGYSFEFQSDPHVEGVSLQIAGYTAVGSGGGWGPEKGKFRVSLSYEQLPTGKLTVVFSELLIGSDAVTWQRPWSPAVPHAEIPRRPASSAGSCLTAESLSALPPLPETFFTGKALMYEILESGVWGLALHPLDGSRAQVVTSAGNWGSLSPDGSRAAYSSTDNSIHIVDLIAQTERVLPGAGGFDLHWSPDGTRLAYVGIGDGAINSVYVIHSDGSQISHISPLSYEAIIGWSADGNQLFFAAPYTGGAAWKVFAYDFNSATAVEQFTIENGTPKFLNPQLSPDGNWIAYRGRDNSSIYLVRPDGSDMRLVVNNAHAVGMAWSRSGWLGISLQDTASAEASVVILKPETCEAYILPALDGDMQGLFIP